MKKILVIAALSCSISGFAQSVNSKLSLKQGQKIQLVTTANQSFSVEMMGQSMETKMDNTITRQYDVLGADNKGATIQHSIKRMVMEVSNPMGGNQKFDTDEKQTGEAETMKEKAIKKTFTITLDENGKMTEVKSSEKAGNEEDNGMMMGMGAYEPKAGYSSELSILPVKQVRKGDMWADSTNITKTVYTLTDVTDKDLVVDFNSVTILKGAQKMNGMEINMDTKNKSKGKILVDRKTGLMREKTEDSTTDGTIEVMGSSAPVTGKSTAKTVVTIL